MAGSSYYIVLFFKIHISAFYPFKCQEEGSNEDLWNYLQALSTITKLTEERSMTDVEKDRLMHELVSNSVSLIRFYHLVFQN
jgi:hypothetical protein